MVGKSGDGLRDRAASDAIARIEALAAIAWSSDSVEDLDGWELRFNAGVTRRANSVWPREHRGRLPTELKLDLVEQAYRQRGLPPLYQIGPLSQPAGLDELLEQRGYQLSHPTCTQIAEIAQIIPHTGFREHFNVTITEDFDELWFTTYCRAEQVSAHDASGRRRILQRCESLNAYALVFIGEQPVAMGWGVLSGDFVGLFSVATVPEYRRRGAASAVLHSLARWGQRHGASQVYLQVLENNRAARGLYTRAGFHTLYNYHYRQAPGTP